MVLTINIALLLGIIVIALLCRPVVITSRFGLIFITLMAFTLGVLLASTSLGEAVREFLRSLSHTISRIFND